MSLSAIASELEALSQVEIWDNRDDLVQLAKGVRLNLGYDEESGYCNCSCCDHGI